MKDMIKEVGKVIKGNKKDIAFLIGNGINIYNSENSRNNWLSLLQDLWNHYTYLNYKKLSFPKALDKIDLSHTEMYDVIKSHLRKAFHSKKKRNVILIEIASDMKSWAPKSHHKKIIEKIRDMNEPVLTTNFDENLSKSINAKFIKKPKGHKGFSHQYPWQCYYSTQEAAKNLKEFAIWNIHGSIHYHRSIKLGLSDYMGMVHKAKEMISDGLWSFKGGLKWRGSKTWLHIFFHSSLFIFGLGLTSEETFLRWLLTERYKYIQRLKETFKMRKKAWYVHVGKEDEIDYGKSLFFKSVNIKILTLPTYKDLYETLWEEL